jgi:transposase
MIMPGMNEGNVSMDSNLSRREGRVNMIATPCSSNLIAPFKVVGACNRTVFETWLEICLVPVLEAGQVVVMDNATFHKGGRIEQLIQNAGCNTIFLKM